MFEFEFVPVVPLGRRLVQKRLEALVVSVRAVLPRHVVFGLVLVAQIVDVFLLDVVLFHFLIDSSLKNFAIGEHFATDSIHQSFVLYNLPANLHLSFAVPQLFAEKIEVIQVLFDVVSQPRVSFWILKEHLELSLAAQTLYHLLRVGLALLQNRPACQRLGVARFCSSSELHVLSAFIHG